MLLEAGQVIDGKYRIVRIIGTGGMGAVYEGENVRIRRRVAIKVLHADSATNADVILRFEREAQAAGEIGNDHILEVLDLGSLPNGDRYIVMEYLDGETLAQRIERLGRLTPQEVAPVALQFLTALGSAHAAGIIHRDLKPENIFILRSKAGRMDFVKLIDFGVSKFSRPFAEGEQRMTHANSMLGTPCYMSPEQARGAMESDVRSDIYSCGVILFEAVTGRLPFEGASFNELMFKIALSDAPSALEYLPSLDPAFAAIIARAIARDPNERYASAKEFSDVMADWMQSRGVPASTRPRAHADISVSYEQPPRPLPERAPVDRESATLAAGEVDLLSLRTTGVRESWTRSETPTTASGNKRRRALRAVGVVVGAVIVTAGIGTAAVMRGRPASPASHTTASVAALADTAAAGSAPAVPIHSSSSSAPLEPTNPEASSAAGALPAPAPSPPSGNAPVQTSIASLTSVHKKPAGPVKTTSSDPHQAGAPVAASAKPKSSPVSQGFDFGY